MEYVKMLWKHLCDICTTGGRNYDAEGSVGWKAIWYQSQYQTILYRIFCSKLTKETSERKWERIQKKGDDDLKKVLGAGVKFSRNLYLCVQLLKK